MKYTPINYHRDGTPNKSQWIIPIKDEVSLFNDAESNSWFSKCSKKAWGIRVIDARVDQIGLSVLRIKLHVAKFVSNANEWHGYPADFVRNAHDIPESIVLKLWLDNKIISKAEATRISKGIPCFQ